MNGGAYAWWTEPNATALCDEQRELCTSRYACGGTSGFCMGLVGGWVEGDGCVCGNDVCDPNENGGSCEQDCCDASTPCGATRGNGGVEYCRNMNGGGYGWWTEAGVLTLCDEVGEICVSTFECGGTWGQCVAIPNGWAEGGC